MGAKSKPGPWVVVRSSIAGVFFGRLVSAEGTPDGLERVTLADVRHVWSWEGALNVGALAAHGVTGGRIAAPVARDTISQVMQRPEASKEAVDRFAAVADWHP